jgi:hypothetical protein
VSSKEPDTVVLTYQEDGKIDRRRLSGILGASTTLLLLLLIVALSLGAIGAAGVGIGGFVVEFSDVTAPSGAIYPALAEQSECGSAPQLTAVLEGEAVIQDHFRVTKGIPIPGNVVDGVSVDIISEAGNNTTVSAEDLELRLVSLNSRTVSLKNASITEYNVDTPPGETPVAAHSYADASDPNSTNPEMVDTEFGIDAPGGFALTEGRAVVYHIAFGNLDIAGLGVTGSLADSDNMTLAGSASNDCDRIFQQRIAADKPYMGEGTDVTNASRAGTQARDESGIQPEEPEGEPQIEVVEITPPRNVTLNFGDRLLVELNVTNVGNATDTWTAYMDIANGTQNDTVDTQNVTVGVNETATVTLEHEVRRGDLPNLEATFGVEDPEEMSNDEASEGNNDEAEPEAEPNIQVLNTAPSGEEPLEVGDIFAVDTRITNEGNATGDWRVYMNVTDDAGENTTVATENVSLESGESANVTFEYEATAADLPSVDATLGVDDLD